MSDTFNSEYSNPIYEKLYKTEYTKLPLPESIHRSSKKDKQLHYM